MSSGDVRISTASTYDQIVGDYAWRTAHISADLIEFRANFEAAVVGDGRVADVGCGPGRDATHFRGQQLRVVGVDASRGMAVRTSADGIPTIQADMRSLPIAGQTLDGIWSVASLLHVPRLDVPSTLRSWWTCLRPRGVLGIGTSLGEDEGWEACPYDAATQQSSEALRRWFVHHEEATLLRLIDEAGFSVLSSRQRVSNRRWLQVLARRREPTLSA